MGWVPEPDGGEGVMGGELNGERESEEDKESQERQPGYFVHAFNTVFQVGRCSFRGVQPSSSAPVFRIVVHEHVVGDGKNVTLDAHCGRYYHLKKRNVHFTHVMMSYS